METMAKNNINIGDYIILQKQSYKKLMKFNKTNACVTLGRDNIHLNGIEGAPYFSTFKMILKGGKKSKDYFLELTTEIVNLRDEIDIKTSGNDNRNIVDDGRSQKLTTAEIEDLRVDSYKASDIVETLITNSSTFHNKTEFAQEKYLKKKEKKYFEFIRILRPNLRLIAEIMFKLDPIKIQGIRMDTLSQIITLANVNSEGTHLLYDSGSNGLLAAALLSAIGPQSNGKLLHLHPGNMSQKQALLGMNLEEEQMSRCVSVNVYSSLRQYYQGCDTNENLSESNPLKRKACDEVECGGKVAKLDADTTESKTETIDVSERNEERKKPKWHFDNIAAGDMLQGKVDSLVIACKEDPKNIFYELVQFVKPGRPFVIYYSVAEPLQELFLLLKSQSTVAALKLTCNWMRNYQVLPDRTHPEVTMNGSSGFLLTGYILK